MHYQCDPGPVSLAIGFLGRWGGEMDVEIWRFRVVMSSRPPGIDGEKAWLFAQRKQCGWAFFSPVAHEGLTNARPLMGG